MMKAPALLSLAPVRARWFYAAAAGVLAMGLLVAPFNIYVGLVIVAAAGAIGYLLGRREDGLRTDSATDMLTGLFNRRYFELSLLRELALCARHGQPLALLMIDVDAMKKINDGGGHDAGDSAIRAVAEALRKTCRTTDLAARWGGDEFVVLVPQTSEAQAMALAQRISACVADGAANRGPALGVRVSIGVAVAIGRSISSSQLFARADAAMYDDKAKGRDGPNRQQPGAMAVTARDRS